MTEGSVPDPSVDKDVIYGALKAIKGLICILKGFFFLLAQPLELGVAYSQSEYKS